MYNRWDNPSDLYLIMHVVDCALLSMDPMFHCHSHMTRCCTQALRVPLLPADDHLLCVAFLSLRLPGVHWRRLPGVHGRSEQPIRWSSMWPDTTTSVLEELRRMVHLWAIHRQTFLKSAKILKSKRLRGHTVEISSAQFARRLYKKLSMSKSHKQRRHFDTRYFEIFWHVAPMYKFAVHQTLEIHLQWNYLCWHTSVLRGMLEWRKNAYILLARWVESHSTSRA